MEDSRSSMGQGRYQEAIAPHIHIINLIIKQPNVHPTFKEGLMGKLRVRNADAKITEVEIVCPYKACGVLFRGRVNRGDTITCPNCRKTIKIRRIV